MKFRNKTRTYSWPSSTINSHFAFQILAFNLIKKRTGYRGFFLSSNGKRVQFHCFQTHKIPPTCNST